MQIARPSVDRKSSTSDYPRVRRSGPNHTPCAQNILPVSEEVDFGLDRGGSQEGWSSERQSLLKKVSRKASAEDSNTIPRVPQPAPAARRHKISMPASLVIWIESDYGRPLLDRCSAPFEQMKHRSALDAVSPPVGQRLLSHFAYLGGKHDHATPSPPRPRAEFKAQPNHTPCTKNDVHTKLQTLGQTRMLEYGKSVHPIIHNPQAAQSNQHIAAQAGTLTSLPLCQKAKTCHLVSIMANRVIHEATTMVEGPFNIEMASTCQLPWLETNCAN